MRLSECASLNACIGMRRSEGTDTAECEPCFEATSCVAKGSHRRIQLTRKLRRTRCLEMARLRYSCQRVPSDMIAFEGSRTRRLNRRLERREDIRIRRCAVGRACIQHGRAASTAFVYLAAESPRGFGRCGACTCTPVSDSRSTGSMRCGTDEVGKVDCRNGITTMPSRKLAVAQFYRCLSQRRAEQGGGHPREVADGAHISAHVL